MAMAILWVTRLPLAIAHFPLGVEVCRVCKELKSMKTASCDRGGVCQWCVGVTCESHGPQPKRKPQPLHAAVRRFTPPQLPHSQCRRVHLAALKSYPRNARRLRNGAVFGTVDCSLSNRTGARWLVLLLRTGGQRTATSCWSSGGASAAIASQCTE